MAIFIAASFLFQSMKQLQMEKQRETEEKVHAVHGLSLNPNSVNRGKNLRFLLEQQPLTVTFAQILHSDGA